jgi:diguanylate cyclase (GGDEF)-like protein
VARNLLDALSALTARLSEGRGPFDDLPTLSAWIRERIDGAPIAYVAPGEAPVTLVDAESRFEDGTLLVQEGQLFDAMQRVLAGEGRGPIYEAPWLIVPHGRGGLVLGPLSRSLPPLELQVVGIAATWYATTLDAASAVAAGWSRTAELERMHQSLTEQNVLLRELTVVDELTGLRNRRFLDRALRYEIARAKRYEHLVSVILIDVDHFKKVNDTYGHPEGDRVLRELARILENGLRQTDVAARYGGEEFCLVLPETVPEGAFKVAERVRAAVESHDWGQLKVTASLGVATTGPEIEDGDALLRAADHALYVAKRSGRNRVEIAAPREVA